jgi:hypothetical protein
MEDKKEKGKREEQRKVKRLATHKNQKKERASPSPDKKLSHPQPLILLACKSRDKKLSHPQPLILLACKSRDLVIVECLK